MAYKEQSHYRRDLVGLSGLKYINDFAIDKQSRLYDSMKFVGLVPHIWSSPFKINLAEMMRWLVHCSPSFFSNSTRLSNERQFSTNSNSPNQHQSQARFVPFQLFLIRFICFPLSMLFSDFRSVFLIFSNDEVFNAFGDCWWYFWCWH